jgi:trehalose utilization protein
MNITVWNENTQSNEPGVKAAYPRGIHDALREALEKIPGAVVTVATLDMPECGLPDEVLNNTDVLFWWGHVSHGEVPDALAHKIHNRVLRGMGLIVLHSAHYSKPFRLLMGTTCSLRWREGDFERLWTLNAAHPIAAGIPMHIEIGEEEMYGEPFDIPQPDGLIFGGWFRGGEICRSGVCYYRGHGKVFYFQPGHETTPTYYNPHIQQILRNAAVWASPPAVWRGRLGCFHDGETVERIVGRGEEIDG